MGKKGNGKNQAKKKVRFVKRAPMVHPEARI